MKRNLILAGLIFLCFILQTTIFPALPIATVVPNLLLILTVVFGFMNGKKQGIGVGFFCGLMVDIFFGNPFGLYILIYMYIGYLNGFFCRIFYDDDIKVPMLLIIASDFVYGLSVYTLQFMLRGRLNFLNYLGHVIIPEIVYTVIITLLVYRLLYKLNYRFIATEMRGSNSNWLRK